MQGPKLIAAWGALCLTALAAGCQGWTPALPGNGEGWLPDFGAPTVPEQTEPPIPPDSASAQPERPGHSSTRQ